MIRRSWREGGGSHWPPQYEPVVEPWPSLDNECWTPTRPGAAITACLRSSENEMQLIDWGSVEQAIEAAEQLFTGSCGSGCRGDHLMLWTDTESVHTARIGPPQPPLPLADELAACYPTQLNHTTLSTTPAFWPAPSILNGPIPRGVPMNPETRRAQDAAVAAAGDRHLVPHPHGLSGRVADAHAQGRAVLAEGDIDGAIGADMLAEALMDEALYEPEAGLG